MERLRQLQRRVYRDPASAARALAAQWRGQPGRLTLDTVAACNISCVMCTIHEWGPCRIMSLDTFRSLRRVFSQVAGASFSCAGEPFLNKKFFQRIAELREIGGVVDVDGTLTIGPLATLNLNGGTLRVGNLDNQGMLNENGGTLIVPEPAMPAFAALLALALVARRNKGIR